MGFIGKLIVFIVGVRVLRSASFLVKWFPAPVFMTALGVMINWLLMSQVVRIGATDGS